MCFFKRIMQSYESWKASRRGGNQSVRMTSITSRPPSEVGSIRSTLSVGTLEDRLARVEDALKQLTDAQKEQSRIMDRQMKIIELLTAKKQGGNN